MAKVRAMITAKVRAMITAKVRVVNGITHGLAG